MSVEQIEILSNEVKNLVALTQDKNDKAEKASSALKESLETEIKSQKEEITSLMTKYQELEASKKESDDALKVVQAEMKRAPLAKNASQASEAVLKFKSAFSDYARKKGKDIDENLIKEYNSEFISKFDPLLKEDAKESLVKTLSVDSNPDGGYLVFPERRAGVDKIREFETSPVRAVANVISTVAESYEIVIDDDESASGGWVSEQEVRNDSDTAQFGKIIITTHEQYAQPKVTQKLLDDISINIENYLSEKTSDIITRTENTAFVSGNGAGKPKGFLSYDAWAAAGTYERGKIERINSGTNGQFVADSIKKLKNSLKGVYQGNAVFGIKRDDWFNIITLKDGDGNYLLDPRSFKDGDTEILLGKRVVFMDDLPTAATGSLSMVYGDFRRGYTIVDRFGLRVLRDNLTDKRYIKFYTTKRVGGAVTNYEALKLYELSA
jgi:HK97 family phage major capsid protein